MDGPAQCELFSSAMAVLLVVSFCVRWLFSVFFHDALAQVFFCRQRWVLPGGRLGGFCCG